MFTRGKSLLRSIDYDNFGMADAAVEASEECGCFRGDDGGFEVGAGEIADGIERTPVGLDDDFDVVFCTAK